MKIKDLLNKEYDNTNEWRVGKADIWKIVNKYGDDDCVIAYLKEKLGITILFRGQKKYFAMIMLRNDLDYGGFDYKMTRIELKDFFKICDSEPNELNGHSSNVVILDEEAYKKAKRSFVMEAMVKDGN